jgi:AraC family transcriptional regulator of adaptative response / DNA-3-methyladenine glycosylase II
VIDDFERCYRAVSSRDPRFDGWFFTAVTSTGIYCRPSCPARTPGREHVRFYPSAAAAQQAGFRACMRCRPDAAPGSPEWNARADVVARAMRLIADGAVDRDGVPALAARLGYSERQIHRLLVAEVGTGALALARAQRAQTARLLVETTDLPVADVAFTAGFASVRQFNHTFRAVFATTPSEARRRRRPPSRRRGAPSTPATLGAVPAAGRHGATATATTAGASTVTLRLAHRQPFDAAATIAFLGARAVSGIELLDGDTYHRTLRLPRGTGTVALRPGGRGAAHVQAVLRLADLRDLTAAVSRCRRLLDLDSDPEAVDADLASDPLLRPLVAALPGLRVPGTVDPAELAVRAVIGQQVSVAGARTVAAHLVAAAGTSLPRPAAPAGGAGGHADLPRLFPTPEEILAAGDGALRMPASRQRTVRALARALADRHLVLDAGSDPEEAEARLREIPGIGPWTAAYVRLRGLGDPDAFLASDLGVRRALERLGQPAGAADAERAAARWRPWRAYATLHLWSMPAGRDGARPRNTVTQGKERAA